MTLIFFQSPKPKLSQEEKTQKIEQKKAAVSAAKLCTNRDRASSPVTSVDANVTVEAKDSSTVSTVVRVNCYRQLHIILIYYSSEYFNL